MLAAGAIGIAAPGDAAAQAACRTDSLGAVDCAQPSASRPRARPPFADPTPGIDGMPTVPPAGSAAPELIPAHRQNSFGRTLVGPGEAQGRGGRCRTDNLGNLRCP